VRVALAAPTRKHLIVKFAWCLKSQFRLAWVDEKKAIEFFFRFREVSCTVRVVPSDLGISICCVQRYQIFGLKIAQLEAFGIHAEAEQLNSP